VLCCAVLCCAVQAYLRSLGDCNEEDGSDGSYEADFVCLWPLDGSAAAGDDLKEWVGQRNFRQNLQRSNARSYGAGCWLPGGYDTTMARLEEDINQYLRCEAWRGRIV
jgi:hypothetical protein